MVKPPVPYQPTNREERAHSSRRQDKGCIVEPEEMITVSDAYCQLRSIGEVDDLACYFNGGSLGTNDVVFDNAFEDGLRRHLYLMELNIQSEHLRWQTLELKHPEAKVDVTHIKAFLGLPEQKYPSIYRRYEFRFFKKPEKTKRVEPKTELVELISEFNRSVKQLISDFKTRADTPPFKKVNDNTDNSSFSESERLALLESAAHPKLVVDDPVRQLEHRVRERTVGLLGGETVFGRPVRNDEELVQALICGFPGQVLRKLQDAGYPHKVLEQVIAPRRTLMRRRAPDQRLTSVESDAAWRLAYILVMASDVLNGPRAAVAWLTRPKAAFGDKAPVDLMETSVGTSHIERVLKRLDWGDVA